MMEERQPLQKVLLGKLVICMQKTETRSKSHPINSKWIKDLKTRPETLKQLQDIEGNILETTGITMTS
jgi:hypothetical protein